MNICRRSHYPDAATYRWHSPLVAESSPFLFVARRLMIFGSGQAFCPAQALIAQFLRRSMLAT
jgi:hypothetical protein